MTALPSGSVAPEDRAAAENQGISVMDGEELVDLIVAHIDDLSEDTKMKLGIILVPMIVIPK